MSDIIPVNIVSNRQPYLDAGGKPLAFGRLLIFTARSSTALAEVYGDAALTARIENPVILDTAGRAPALYSASAAYVRVEKFIGRDEYGENLYEFVYDYETPPGIDISGFWNVNFVDYYSELKQLASKLPVFVLKEGDPHLYVWNPSVPSTGLNDVTDIGSSANPGGSWHWETKRISADQAGIRNDGAPYSVSRWHLLASLSARGVAIEIPRGSYEFGGADMTGFSSDTFWDLSIAASVDFLNFGEWEIYAVGKVSCLSPQLGITWRQLPQGQAYDTRYFNKIRLSQLGIGSADSGKPFAVDLIARTPEFECDIINKITIAANHVCANLSYCSIREISRLPGMTGTLSFRGTCETARTSYLENASLLYSRVEKELVIDSALEIPEVLQPPSSAIASLNRDGSISGGTADFAAIGAAAPGSINSIVKAQNRFPDTRLFTQEAARRLVTEAGTSATGYIYNDFDFGDFDFTVRTGQRFRNCVLRGEITVPSGQMCNFSNCDIRSVKIMGDLANAVFTGCRIGRLDFSEVPDDGNGGNGWLMQFDRCRFSKDIAYPQGRFQNNPFYRNAFLSRIGNARYVLFEQGTPTAYYQAGAYYSFDQNEIAMIGWNSQPYHSADWKGQAINGVLLIGSSQSYAYDELEGYIYKHPHNDELWFTALHHKGQTIADSGSSVPNQLSVPFTIGAGG